MSSRVAALIFLATGLLAGCNSVTPGRDSSRAEAPVEAPAPPEAGPEAPETAGGEVIPPEMYADALADCARRSGKAAETLQVVRAEAVTWRDGSLGCPEPGLLYSQALVDGYWLVFTDGRRQYDYRAGLGGSFMYCAEPRSGPEPGH